MKKLILISLFFLFATINFAQEIYSDSINYRAYVVAEYYEDKKIGDVTDDLFAFRGDIVITSIKGQRRAFYIEEGWEQTNLSTGHSVKIAQAYDNGGFRVGITLGYDTNSETYFIILAYNNVNFFYEVETEEIEIEKELFIYQKEAPTYTDEEIRNFLKQYGDPDVILESMLFELWFML